MGNINVLVSDIINKCSQIYKFIFKSWYFLRTTIKTRRDHDDIFNIYYSFEQERCFQTTFRLLSVLPSVAFSLLWYVRCDERRLDRPCDLLKHPFSSSKVYQCVDGYRHHGDVLQAVIKYCNTVAIAKIKHRETETTKRSSPQTVLVSQAF